MTRWIRILASSFALAALVAPAAAPADDQPITDTHLINLLPSSMPLFCYNEGAARLLAGRSDETTAVQFHQIADALVTCSQSRQAQNSSLLRYRELLGASAAALLAARREGGQQQVDDARAAATLSAGIDGERCRVAGCPTTVDVRDPVSGYHVPATVYNLPQTAHLGPLVRHG